MYIVQRKQAQSQYLVRDVQVAQVGPRKTPARSAIARLVHGTAIGPELRALDVEPAGTGERGSIAAHARRRDAVEEVHSPPDAFDQVLREPDAHEVPWTVSGQLGVQQVEHRVHVRLAFADGKAADGDAVPVVHSGDGSGSIRAEFGMDPSLHDGKQSLS